jgi:hypothetical protein
MKFLKFYYFIQVNLFLKNRFLFHIFFRDVSRTERIDFCDRELHTHQKKGGMVWKEKERKKREAEKLEGG